MVTDYGAGANGKPLNENQIATLSLEASEDRRTACRNDQIKNRYQGIMYVKPINVDSSSTPDATIFKGSGAATIVSNNDAPPSTQIDDMYLGSISHDKSATKSQQEAQNAVSVLHRKIAMLE